MFCFLNDDDDDDDDSKHHGYIAHLDCNWCVCGCVWQRSKLWHDSMTVMAKRQQSVSACDINDCSHNFWSHKKEYIMSILKNGTN